MQSIIKRYEEKEEREFEVNDMERFVMFFQMLQLCSSEERKGQWMALNEVLRSENTYRYLPTALN